MKAAIRSTRRAAALLERPIAEDPVALGQATTALLGQILERIRDREIEQLLELPVMLRPESLAYVTLLRNCAPAAFQTEPLLAKFCTLQIVLESLVHGGCPASAQAYCSLGGILLGTDHHHAGVRFARLGVALNRRLGDRAARPGVDFVFAMSTASWIHPLAEAIGLMRDAAQIGHELGEHVIAGNAVGQEIALRMLQGSEPLGDICHAALGYRQICQQVGDTAAVRILGWQIDRIRVLMGELESMTAEDSDSQSSLVAVREEANSAQQFSLLVMMVDVAYAAGDVATALELATATRLLEPAVARMVTVSEHRFLHCLAAVAMCRKRPGMRRELEPVIAGNQRILHRWVTECPANFEPMYLLVEAERAALDGEVGRAIDLYDRATASAQRHGRRRLEALSHELYGQFWIERSKPEIAQIYLTRARNVNLAIGAQRKVRQLERLHRGIPRGTQLRPLGTVTSNIAAEVLDVTAIAKATRVISGELDRDRLLEIMLEIMFENAGAEGGALVLETPLGLVSAASRVAGARTVSPVPVPIAAAALPRSVIHYVHRTGVTVVLDDATEDARFANDDYIQTRRPRSVLCMPVRHKDRLMAVLYLENTLVSGAFTQARLDALTILASQIAVSLDNAALFAAQRVQAEVISRANDELRSEIAVRQQAELELAGYRTHLEDLIAERTKELTLANQKLRDAAEARERIEGELRLAQKLESVGRLAAGIAHEINTPVQFVSDSLTFMREMLPSLIDTIGHYRALATTLEACIADYDAHDGERDRANRDRLVTALARTRAAEAEADVDYAVANGPASLTSAFDGLGRVAAIVRSMKDFAHPDRDEKTLVDLNRAIESTLMIAANECKYVATVHTELSPLPLIRCNGGEINQAVLNLVINAAHAIRDVVGQSGSRGKISVRTRHDGDEVEIAISDTGTGIPPGIHDKIYDPFFTTKEVGRGTGQGLAIVRGVIVDKHGGSLRFDTEPGAGTTFYLRLPIGDAMDSAA